MVSSRRGQPVAGTGRKKEPNQHLGREGYGHSRYEKPKRANRQSKGAKEK